MNVTPDALETVTLTRPVASGAPVEFPEMACMLTAPVPAVSVSVSMPPVVPYVAPLTVMPPAPEPVDNVRTPANVRLPPIPIGLFVVVMSPDSETEPVAENPPAALIPTELSSPELTTEVEPPVEKLSLRSNVVPFSVALPPNCTAPPNVVPPVAALV